MSTLTKFFGVILITLFSTQAVCEDISLTIEEYDTLRNRASLLVVDTSQVPLGTTLRVHSKTGVCTVQITERVNDHLIGITYGCDEGVISPGMKLAYSTPAVWDTPTRMPTESQISTNYNSPNILNTIMERTTFSIGHSFASQLEGNVYANGLYRDLDGDTALTLGIKGRVYDFNDRLYLTTELSYDSPRTLDQVTTSGNSIQGTQGYSPRMSLWTIAVSGEARVLDRVNGFLGLNISLPNLSNSPFALSGDLGLQAGANYQLYKNIAIEGLIKVSNMNLRNDLGEITDVSLAGLEIRGRYNF